jgi:small subunit ribosomal protein S5
MMRTSVRAVARAAAVAARTAASPTTTTAATTAVGARGGVALARLAGRRDGETRAVSRGFAASADGGGDGNGDDARDGAMDAREKTLDERYRALFRRFEEAPSRRKRFLLNLALKGEVMMEDDDEGASDSAGGSRQKRALQTRVIDVNRTTKVTKGGDLTNYTAMVVVGNGDGVIGFGTGKASEVGAAIDKAYRKASVSLVYVKRFEEHTIYHEVKGKYCKTICNMLPAPSGSGIVANDTVEAICTLAGIKNIKAKVHGSHHPHNTVRAVFAALESVESPEDVARRTGSMVFRVAS